MSGIVGSKLNIRGSNRIAKLGTDGQVLTSAGAGVAAAFEDLAAGISWQTIVTGSTMNAVAGNGYWIDTTSNACTITLPDSASNGDEIMFVDYARNWGTNGIEIDSNGLNYQTQDDTYTVEYGTDGTALHIVYSGATNGWIPTLDKTVEDVPSAVNLTGIFGFGTVVGGAITGVTNLVSNAGVVASDVAAVGTARTYVAACEYGGNKGIFGYGYTATYASMTNLVSNAGVVASDVAGVGTARMRLAGCRYGGHETSIFGFGDAGSYTAVTNLVSSSGVVASDQAAVTGNARQNIAACEYGGDKGIFGFGHDGSAVGMTNLVSNTGVVASDVVAVGTARASPGACEYGDDKGIFAYGGGNVDTINLVSNVGVVASDSSGAGTGRTYSGACEYGGDKGIFGYGEGGAGVGITAVSNLVSNAGVVASDQAAVTGTARKGAAACTLGG